ncbi:MAG: 50S ribosomal protein L6 [Candidatus Colwellbacteria bacterium CG10_big_fil_rev_8_21_14_0_10_42_22]|uniref:Large ribosomal subunit protein uL6 n=1 Tax=Candidatus Colwellbacteria bacterium CG10_big_fil_rev_8_21_14_0_10_42_22 TaxID=1974540 RepID=A0A2H0VFA3_9BACT|nr:MAG: 50S ribosomal protein L6 [Candidatus Colwellbacteria bacterium CG10_big_fil_rev_8_21_14_0_10_42_22]
MSKIGKSPVNIPDGVTVELKEKELVIKGPNAILTVPMLEGIDVEIKDNFLVFQPKLINKQTKSNWGTMRSLAQSAIIGSKENYSKKLLIEGVGYRANMEGNTLVMNLGFSHPVKLHTPDGITIEVEGNSIKVSGASKALVGEVAANIRKFKKPEPYKGKGIRYENEIVRRKAGKKAVGTS